MVVKYFLKTVALGIPLLYFFHCGDSCSIPLRHEHCVRNSPRIKSQSHLEERIDEIRKDLSIPDYVNIQGKVDDERGTSISRKTGFDDEYLIELSNTRSECSLVHELCHISLGHHDKKGKLLVSKFGYHFLDFFKTRYESQAIRCQEKYYRDQIKNSE